MKIAICDDERDELQKISEHIARCAEEYMLEIEIDFFTGGEELLFACKSFDYQVVFLDIYMNGISGIEAAYQIHSQNENCAIAFITSSPDFRAEGFDLGAIHYIVKPVTYENIETAVRRCIRLLASEERYLNVMVERQPIRIKINDIIFLEVYSKKVFIHTGEKIVETRMSLSEIEQMLQNSPFLRSHRCYIVNMRLIIGILDFDFLMKSNEKVPIRKNGAQKVKEEYKNYLFNSVRRINR